jgi:glucose/arabinose dehydrogenase
MWGRFVSGRPSPARVLLTVALSVSFLGGGMTLPSPTRAALPTGFTDTAVITGLTEPTAMAFAGDGRIFVAEKSGRIKVFDSLSDSTATIFADLRANVHNFWDRGMLGMALAPNFPIDPWVYVLYTYDAMPGGTAPRWGTTTSLSDGCPNPPGATGDGCVVTGRLSRLQASGDVMVGSEQVLITDWCQQYPSHSIGSLAFGADGALYVSGGDGASFNFVDWGQDGDPVNPCGDPPGGVGAALTPPTAEGGALRSQDLRTMPSSGSDYQTLLAGMNPSAQWRLGETAGTTAADSVGTSHGTYAGGVSLGQPSLLVGSSNGAARFDGTNDEVTVPSSAALNPTSQMSVVAWVNADTWSGGNRRVIQKGTSDTQWMLRTTNSGTKLEFRIAGIGAPFTNTLPATGVPHLLVGTYDGTSVRLYVDGALVSTRSASGSIPTGGTALAIGNKPGSTVAGDHFDGVVDEVSVHPVALTGSQVSQLWTAGTQGGGGGGTTDPVTLDGSILRLDPATGAAMAGNPLIGSADLNARRIVAYGLRNPFRFTIRPGTSEVWAGDVGMGTWEEINRITSPTAGVLNFGWPCYEGSPRNGGYDSANLSICENLYATAAAHTAPYYAYRHDQKPVVDTCPTGSSSISGLAFYEGGSYPSSYAGSLFFSDYSRDCIWVMRAGTNGLPDPTQVQSFETSASNPVQLTIGPGGDVFYVDFGGSIHRISFLSNNQPPTAVASAQPTSGTAPLTVQFDGSGSSDPDLGDTLTYAWDLDGDGAFDDSTSVNPQWTYQSPATVTVRLRVTDPDGAFDTDSVVINAGNSPPVPVIDAPTAATSWAVDDLIAFSGHASDEQQGTLPASALSWSLTVEHCPSNCHTHPIQSFPGVASGSFSAPDHEYPSHLELTLTATDAQGASASTTVRLDPRTVDLTLASVPSGLDLTINGRTATAPFTTTVIEGSTNTISAPSPQTAGGSSWTFSSWSDGGAATHTIDAGSADATLTATFEDAGSGTVHFLDGFESGDMSQWTSNSGIVVSSADAFAGQFGASANSTGAPAYATENLTTPQSVVFIESRVKVVSQGSTTSAYLFRLRNASGVLIAGLYRNVDGNLRLKNDTGNPGANSAVVVTTGTWHLLQWRVVIGGAAGESEVWLDGVRVGALSGTFNLGTAAVGRLQMGENNSGRVFHIAFDDVRVADRFAN